MLVMELVLFNLIDDPFVYIIISHGDLDKSEFLWFLNHLNVALEDFLLTDLVVGTDSLTQNCLQSHFDLVFSKLMALSSIKRHSDSNCGGSSIGRVGKGKKGKGGALEVNNRNTKDGCGRGDDGEIVGMEKKKYKHIGPFT
ncbi:hypothetical protein PVK06_007323 [Gossypium arboreum]|uniref:Uncharacterized protein n=1 Tax=Gossypium arboreum TaxID=29729 RepID=A0ABR0QH60_GOSAR|nr:hypothetical protein PVK06_007323 [Gossypium arboreum]